MEHGYSFTMTHRGHIALVTLKIFNDESDWLDFLETLRERVEEEFRREIDAMHEEVEVQEPYE
ncbi:hypothetical protein FACS189472_17610 [Alphaproteobacteria bacterium]|nr:hypothetical protein FACS189472_17610 [Alphaproteobacteria bacterium]